MDETCPISTGGRGGAPQGRRPAQRGTRRTVQRQERECARTGAHGPRQRTVRRAEAPRLESDEGVAVLGEAVGDEARAADRHEPGVCGHSRVRWDRGGEVRGERGLPRHDLHEAAYFADEI